MADPTPFKTRSRLLSVYRKEVEDLRAGRDPFPVQVEVNLSGSCNQSCAWCISANAHHMSKINLGQPGVPAFFHDFKRLGGRAVGWSGGGEPTNHPEFDRALEMVAEARLAQGLLTHGGFPVRFVEPIARRCDWVRVSVDTHDAGTYGKRRGADARMFQLVLDNVRALVAVGGAQIGLNMNVSEWNRGHIRPLFDLARELKVRYLQVRPTLPTPFEKNVPPDNHLRPESVASIIDTLNVVEADRSLGDPELVVSADKFHDLQRPSYGRDDPGWGYRGCKSHRLFVVVNYNGDLVVCMYHLDKKRFTFGNIYDASLEQVWHSEARRQALSFCEDLDHRLQGCQACCKGHEINKVLLSPLGRSLEPDKSPPGSPFL